jgi:hypothetical protein
MAELTPSFTVSSNFGAPFGNPVTTPSLMRDGSYADASCWAATPGNGAYIRVDLGSAKTIQKIGVGTAASFDGGYINGCKIQSSANGSSWTDRATLSGQTAGATKDYALGISARYWQIVGISGLTDDAIVVAEFRIHELSIASLVPDDATSGSSSDGVTLAAKSALSLADGTHTSSSDSPTLSALSPVAPEDAMHLQESESVSLAFKAPLIVDESHHDSSADAVTLSARSTLDIEDAFHAHEAEEAYVGVMIHIDDALHGQVVIEPILLAASALDVNSADHGQSADMLTLAANYALAIADAWHELTGTSPTITLLAVTPSGRTVRFALSRSTGRTLHFAMGRTAGRTLRL